MGKLNVFILVFLIGSLPALAQQNAIDFKHISTADGLSQSSVITMIQDSLGQFWFGTRDGLNKYDSNQFTVYKNQPNDSLSLSNSDILSLDQDAYGNLWIGTYNGLNKYDPLADAFTRFPHSESNGISNNIIWSVNALDNGEIWIGTSHGLSIFNPSTHKFTNYYADPTDLESLPQNMVLDILEDPNGRVWIATANGLSTVIREGDRIRFLRITSNYYIQDLNWDATRKLLWVATRYNGLLAYQPQSNTWVVVNQAQEKVYKNVRSLIMDDVQNLWIGTYDGLYILSPSGELNHYLNDPFDKSSLSRNTIKSVYKDIKGSIWIGSYYGGLNIYDVSNSNFKTLDQSHSKSPLSYDVVSSIAVDDMQQLYFGTEGGGITIYNSKTKDVEYITLENTQGKLLSNNIKSMLLDKNLLYIGTFNAGLAIYDIKSKKFTTNVLSNSLQNALNNTGVYSIKKQGDDLWLATFSDGVFRYQLKTEQLYNYQSTTDCSAPVPSNSIRTMLVENDSVIWLGTQKGISRLSFSSPEEFSAEFYLYQKTQDTGEDILCIFRDSKDRLWVGSKYSGLYLYNGQKFEQIDLKPENETITAIHSIVEDHKNHLWLATSHGILNYNPMTKKTELYNQRDGLVNKEFNDNAALRLDTNEFYFGGPLGVTSFNAETLVKNKFSPRVLLTDLKIQNRSISPKEEHGILSKSIQYTRSIDLDYDKANFSIAYAMPNFINSGNNSYSYRLLGLDEEWTYTTNTSASYTIQNPGLYIFQVRGANNDGVWNDVLTTLEIRIHPAPWRSWWAFMIYALLIGLSLYGLLFILRTRSRYKHHLALEKIESENIKAINQAKLQFFTNISHEFRTPLTLILGPLQQLLSQYNGSSKVYKKLLVIESNANHLLQLINRLMDFRKLENHESKLHAAQGNIVKFLKEIYLSFDEYAKGENYKYTFVSDQDPILVYYDRSKLERVFFNLLSNAFRYTEKGGNVQMKVYTQDQNAVIEVRDSGIGIAEEYLDKVFDRFFEIGIKTSNHTYHKGTGIGLSIAKNIVNYHQGTIGVENIPDGGARFVVRLPLGNAHLTEQQIINDFKSSDDISQYVSQLQKPEISFDQELSENIIEKEKRTILLVEDHAPLRSFMRTLLKDQYNILEAKDGKVAMEIALRSLPDLIVSDVIMPEMVGTELCANIKQNLKTSHIPVILLTSRTSLIYKVEGLESGADDYISKPFDITEFNLRVRNMIESNERLRQKFTSENVLTPSDVTISSLDEELLKKALKIVETHMDDADFDIPTFSIELGVSRTILFTKVKAWTTLTPNEFIQEIRMKRAAQLLEHQGLNVSQVCYKVGYRNPKYFSRLFQKKYGLTPSLYIKKFSSYD